MDQYHLRASNLNGYSETVRELGGDPQSLLRQYGLQDAGRDPEAWVSYTAWLNLLEHSADLLACPVFGLRLSARQGIDVLGVVGFLMRQAPDVRTALEELARYFNHINQGAVISTRVENGSNHWGFYPKKGLDACIHQQSDLVAGIGIKVMRLLATHWQPSAIYLPHAAPADSRLYRERFPCPVYFDQEATVIVSDAAILDAPISEANPGLHRILQDHLSALQSSFPHDYPAQIRDLIRQSLLTGNCSLERVADYMGANKRTLQRKLRAQGTTYQTLLDEVRFDIACHYLRNQSGPLTALSHSLCYSELSAFSNAFRQRFGESPREWQKRTSG